MASDPLVEQLRQAELLHPRVSLWTMDEHRIGLKPILRRVWAPTGQLLICPVQPRYEWLLHIPANAAADGSSAASVHPAALQASRIRALSKSNLARPYICRFSSLTRVTWPST